MEHSDLVEQAGSELIGLGCEVEVAPTSSVMSHRRFLSLS